YSIFIHSNVTNSLDHVAALSEQFFQTIQEPQKCNFERRPFSEHSIWFRMSTFIIWPMFVILNLQLVIGGIYMIFQHEDKIWVRNFSRNHFLNKMINFFHLFFPRVFK